MHELFSEGCVVSAFGICMLHIRYTAAESKLHVPGNIVLRKILRPTRNFAVRIDHTVCQSRLGWMYSLDRRAMKCIQNFGRKGFHKVAS
jgi:hypothetical protein